jgi:heme oxygenase
MLSDATMIPAPESRTLAAQMRAATAALHVRAERSGIIADLLRGRGDRMGYALLLRNLLPIYRAIEDGLERHRDGALLRPFARRDLYRAPQIACDLAAIVGADWTERIGLLPAGARYASRVTRAAEGDGAALIAHAYVRTLGDMSGGQVVAKVLGRTLGLPESALGFYAFPGIDLPAAKADWRDALDAAAPADPARVIHEARVAFRLNIALSEAVSNAARQAGFISIS